jgi:hypothetical protein
MGWNNNRVASRFGWNGFRSGRVKNKFSAGDKVSISKDFHWAKGATGTIAQPPDAVTAIGGRWDGGLTKSVSTARGPVTVYWVWFDEPQRDADGDGPYSGGEIWESALTLRSSKLD